MTRSVWAAVLSFLSSRRGPLWAIVAVSLFTLAPALIDPRAMTGDSFIAYRWQAHFARSFWQGDLYPRWLPDLNYGLGSPAFFIYPPLSQWLPALLNPIWPGDAAAGTRMVAVLAFCRILAGLGAMRWIEAMGVSRAGALLGGIAYLLLPYHAFSDTYQRAACAELVAMAILPWGLRYAHGVRDRTPFAWAGFALALTALLYTHAPTALFGAAFICLYALCLADRRDWPALWARVGMLALLSVALAAAYLGPALTQLGDINRQHLFDSIYQPLNYLFFSAVRWPDPGIEAAALIVFSLHVMVFGGLLLALGRARSADMRARWFLIIAMPLIFLLMSEPARPLWQGHFPWAKIQFAWRMLSLQTLILAGLAGLAWDAVPKGRFAAHGRLLLLLLLPALLAADVAMLGVRVWRAWHRTTAWPTAEVAAPGREVNEYWLGDFYFARDFGPEKVRILAGRAQATPLVWRSRAVVLDVRAATPARIAIRQYAYTGWDMRIDGQGWRPAGRMAPPYNLVVVQVSPGRHRIELRMPPTPAESRGILISSLAFGLLSLGLIGEMGRRRLARQIGHPISTASDPRYQS